MKQKLFTLFLALVANVVIIYASNTQVGGIWFVFDEFNKTATVTYHGSYYNDYSNEYSGSVVIPSSVTYNGTTYSVTSIGREAFSGCSKLSSVTIPNSVTSIGEEAFSGTGIFTNAANWKNGALYINDCLIEVGVNTSGAYSIESGTRLIANGAFRDCSSLTSITIPNSVTSIGEEAFSGTGIFTNAANWKNGALYINDCLIEVGRNASGAYSIESGTRLIANCAFHGCSSLTSVILPNSVTSIGGSAFWSCSSLTSITIPNSVTSVGDYAFKNCSSLTSVILTALSEEEFCKGQGNSLLYSKGVNYQREIQINGTKVTKFTIPNSVTSIGDYAFYNCSSLTYVTIPNSVTSIGKEVFYKCSSLTSVTIPNSVTSIGSSVFFGCSSFTSVILTALSEEEFCKGQGNSLLYSKGVNYQREIQINGTKVTKFTIPNSVTSIGNYAFYNCSSLTSVTIGNGVTSIGELAFYGCTSLTSITIPNSVTSIGNSAFNGCSSLTSVIIGNGVTSIGGGAFYKCSSLTSITIPNSVTGSIGLAAFSKCSSLISVIIGNNVTSIGDYAFRDCSSLSSITIGNSVTSIRDQVFYGCSSLSSITCKAETPPTDENGLAFHDIGSESITVYVPCGCAYKYKGATGWRTCHNFLEMEGYTISIYVNDTKMGTTEVNNKTCKNAQIVATPKPGFRFVQWSDGVVNNPRNIVLTQDTVLIAEFAEVPSYVVEVVYNPDHGTVNGQGTYKEDEEVTLTATANDGYKFHKWSNGVTDNPYTFFVKSDVALEAKFTSTEGIEEVLNSEVHTTKVLRDDQVLILRNGKTYTLQGQEVK